MKVTRLFESMPSWQSPVLSAALAATVFVWGTGTLASESTGSVRQSAGEVRSTLVIGTDPDSKRAERDAKRAAREAKKKAKAEERAMAKAQKSGKRSSSSSANLGDNDPLEGL